MEKPDFKTVHASVRPPRVAVLVDKSDEDWRHTCLRIIEFFSRLWGGAYNIIIPTDGASIDGRFWTILETFDPDYLYRYQYRYQKSGEDLSLSHPEKYEEILDRHVEAAVRGGSEPDAARAQIDKHLRNDWLSHLDIAPALQEQVKTRLAPFWFEGYAVDSGAVSAGCSEDEHLTALTSIIGNTEHPSSISVVEAPEDLVPTLWFSAVTGRLTPDAISSFQRLGIGHDLFTITEDNVKDLVEFVVTGEVRAARAGRIDSTIFGVFPGNLPFNVSMLQLGLYRSTRYRYWNEPLLIVAGNGFEDFCLYYCLSRLRDRVAWVLPSITDKALGSNTDTPMSRAETNFLFDVSGAERSNKFAGGTACISYSLTSEQVDGVIGQMGRSAARQYASQIRRIDGVQSLIALPRHDFAVSRPQALRDRCEIERQSRALITGRG